MVLHDLDWIHFFVVLVQMGLAVLFATLRSKVLLGIALLYSAMLGASYVNAAPLASPCSVQLCVAELHLAQLSPAHFA